MSYQSEVLADSPVAYWRLGESSGTTASDISGNGLNGTYSAVTLAQTGALSGDANTAAAFNGTSSKVDCGNPSALQITGNITVEAWVKFNAFPTTTLYNEETTYAVIAEKGYDGTNEAYTLRINNTGGTRMLEFGSYEQTSTLFERAQYNASAFTTGVWYHIAGTFNGTAWKLFVNGSVVNTTNSTQGPRASSAAFEIGSAALSGSSNRWLNGTIDEVAVYNTALSDARIGAHYTEATSGGGGTPPSAPSALSATAVSSSQINLAWTDNASDESGFEVERSPNGSTGWTQIATKSANVTTHNDTGLTASTQYFYRVRAVNGAGNSSYSSTADDTTDAGGGGDVTAPTITARTVPSDGTRINLTFSESVSGVNASNFVVTVNGMARAPVTASGGGTSWDLEMGLHWIKAGDTVTLAYSGSAVVDAASNPLAAISSASVTNSSVVTQAMANYAGWGFGMFLHYNMSTYHNVEWATGGENPNTFLPTTSDFVDQWVEAAKNAGMKYMVLTTKHHDGFCLWPSDYTTHDIASSSWYAGGGFDIVQQFTTKARAAGMGVVLYFSIWDRNWESANTGFTAQQRTDFIKNQLTELLTRYGRIDGIWTDGWGWQSGYGSPIYSQIYSHIKALQPNCVLAENNHQYNLTNSDIAIWEDPVEGITTSGNRFPSETADTIRVDENWFWKAAATTYKTATDQLPIIATVNSRRGAFLMNVPPDTTGKLPADAVLELSRYGRGSLQPALLARESGSTAPRVSVF